MRCDCILPLFVMLVSEATCFWSSLPDDRCPNATRCYDAIFSADSHIDFCFDQGSATSFCHQRLHPVNLATKINFLLYSTRNDGVQQRNYTVIVVEWLAGASPPDYFQATANTRYVGKAMAQLIETLDYMGFSDAEREVTIIGYSLGAHAAGYAGAALKTHKPVDLIIGLDPAGPLFEEFDEESRLDESDARRVVVIHTNGETFIKGGFGTYQRLGHLDIYVNGGRHQTGCNDDVLGAVTSLMSFDFTEFSDTASCSHHAVLDLWQSYLDHGWCQRLTRCESEEKWSTGECFEFDGITKKQSCDSLNADHLLEGHDCTGAYYFATPLVAEAEDPDIFRDYCGVQYLLDMHFGSTTFGSLSITVIDADGVEDTIGNVTLSASPIYLSRHASIVALRQVLVPVQVRLIYTPYTNMWGFFSSSSIESIELVRVDGRRFAIDEPINVMSGEELMVPFINGNDVL